LTVSIADRFTRGSSNPFFANDLVDGDFFGDPLELQQAHLARGTLHLVHGQIHGFGEAHLTGFGDTVDACRDIDRLTEDVVVGQRHFARIDGDAYIEPIVTQFVFVVLAQQWLNFDTG
jgi:hypothetical protein